MVKDTKPAKRSNSCICYIMVVSGTKLIWRGCLVWFTPLLLHIETIVSIVFDCIQNEVLKSSISRKITLLIWLSLPKF